MPGRDGSGPMGFGAMTGKGFGACTGVSAARGGVGFGFGLGRGCRRGAGGGYGAGFGRGFGLEQNPARTQKELLEEQKGFLQRRLEVVGKQLEDL